MSRRRGEDKNPLQPPPKSYSESMKTLLENGF
jgi:hypothetical protein